MVTRARLRSHRFFFFFFFFFFMWAPTDYVLLGVEFRTDVFDAATVEVLVERLGRVLIAMTADPARRLSSMDVLDDAE